MKMRLKDPSENLKENFTGIKNHGEDRIPGLLTGPQNLPLLSQLFSTYIGPYDVHTSVPKTSGKKEMDTYGFTYKAV